MPYDFHLAPEDIVADVCTGLLRNRAASQSHLRHLRIGVNWWRRSRDCRRRLSDRPVCTAAWARRGRPAWARRGTRGRSPASPRAPARWSTAAAAQPCTAAWISSWLRLLRWRCVLTDVDLVVVTHCCLGTVLHCCWGTAEQTLTQRRCGVRCF